MNNLINKLILYRDLGKDPAINKITSIIDKLNNAADSNDNAQDLVGKELGRLVAFASDFQLSGDIWLHYITYRIIMDENPFSLACEKNGAPGGSIETLAVYDLSIIIELITFDFAEAKNKLIADRFSLLRDYRAADRVRLNQNAEFGDMIRYLSDKLIGAKNADDFFNAVAAFYKDCGVGAFAFHRAFRINDEKGSVKLCPIQAMDTVSFNELVGYENQKRKLIENTEAFVRGQKANNVLLFGDSGTGKSTSIKAVVNAYFNRGIRLIEVYKHQMKDLPAILSILKSRNYKFILYMDDLSFEEFETDYKFLKAVIEGGTETKPEHILVYATSNRRHLIKKTWKDRSDMEIDNDIHRSDSMEEKLCLVNRFGCIIHYSKPSRQDYFDIVLDLAMRFGIDTDQEELCRQAAQWEMSHGGISGRTAQQFINAWLSHADNTEVLN